MSQPHAEPRPAELKTVDLPQGRVRYREAGPRDAAAPVVVFVHGLLVNGSLWSDVADVLAEAGIRSIAPDLPLGAHPIALAADADLSPRGVARLVLDLLAALDLTGVTLVGNDTGGALCQFVVDTDAARIGSLVLTNCDAFDQFPPKPFGVLVRLCKHPALLRAALRPARAGAIRHSALGFGPLIRNPRALDPQRSRGWVEPVLTDRGVGRDLARFAKSVDPAELLDVSTRLGRFGKPVTLAWGTADRFFTLDLGRRLRDAFGAATMIEVEGAKTFVAIDEPQHLADAITRIGQAG